jgi:hypothetical protein
MRFNAPAFDRHLTNIGQRVLWRRSYGCACVNPVSGAPDPKHALCGGKGRIWNDPVETVTGIARQETVAEWAQSGLWESGDMVLSIPQSSPLWDAGMFDRVTMLNSNDVFSQPLIRGAPLEKLLFVPETITRVFWLHPTTRQIVEGGIPTIGVDGIPVWVSGEPPMGATYSMTGTKYSEYFLFDKFPSDRNQHSGMRLPKRVVARKWDLFGR